MNKLGALIVGLVLVCTPVLAMAQTFDPNTLTPEVKEQLIAFLKERVEELIKQLQDLIARQSETLAQQQLVINTLTLNQTAPAADFATPKAKPLNVSITKISRSDSFDGLCYRIQSDAHVKAIYEIIEGDKVIKTTPTTINNSNGENDEIIRDFCFSHDIWGFPRPDEHRFSIRVTGDDSTEQFTSEEFVLVASGERLI